MSQPLSVLCALSEAPSQGRPLATIPCCAGHGSGPRRRGVPGRCRAAARARGGGCAARRPLQVRPVRRCASPVEFPSLFGFPPCSARQPCSCAGGVGVFLSWVTALGVPGGAGSPALWRWGGQGVPTCAQTSLTRLLALMRTCSGLWNAAYVMSAPDSSICCTHPNQPVPCCPSILYSFKRIPQEHNPLPATHPHPPTLPPPTPGPQPTR